VLGFPEQRELTGLANFFGVIVEENSFCHVLV
jgi:hypothetical protein